MTTPFDVPMLKRGDPINTITADQQNAITRAVRQDYSINRGVSNKGGQFASKEVNSVDRWEYLEVHEDIPPHSVFTMETGPEYSRFLPRAKTKQVTEGEPYNTIVTNDDWKLKVGVHYYCALIGLEEPKLIKYDETEGVPKVDDTLGPKPGTYKASKKYKGLVAVSSPDEEEKLIWVIRDFGVDGKHPMFEFVEELHPGEVARAVMLEWDGATNTYVIDHNNIVPYKLYDPEEQNFFMPKERTHAIHNPLVSANGVAFADYEIVGEHGLRRRVRVQQDIQCGSTGLSTIFTKPGNKRHPPLSQQPSCTANDHNTRLNGCNVHGTRRQLVDGEISAIDYDHGRQAWIYEQEDRPNVIEAYLSSTLCPGDNYARISGATFMDWRGDKCASGPVPPVTYITNSKGLAGLQGDTVFAHRYEGRTGRDEWHIFQVEHREKLVLRSVEKGNEQSCADLVFEGLEIAVMTCKTDVKDSLSFGVLADVVVDWKVWEEGCGISLFKETLCVLGRAPLPDVDIPLESLEVLSEWQDQGKCDISISTKTICVLKAVAGDDIKITGPEISVITDWWPAGCGVAIRTADICALGVPTRREHTVPLIQSSVVTSVDFGVADPSTQECAIRVRESNICAFGATPTSDEFIPLERKPVAYGIVELGNCTELKIHDLCFLPHAAINETTDTIFCVVDCETQPTEVLTEASANGTYSVGNKQTRPYDPSGTTVATDITIEFPSSGTAVEGDFVHITNNTLSDKPITLDGNGNDVQALTAPFTTATVVAQGPRLSITFQLRLIGGSLYWRIV